MDVLGNMSNMFVLLLVENTAFHNVLTPNWFVEQPAVTYTCNKLYWDCNDRIYILR